MQNKKVLFVATVPGHINTFHIPYLKLFKDKGYEVHVASNRNDDIKYCDRKIIIPIKRSPYKISNLKAIKELKKTIEEEKYEIIHCHTPMGGVVARLAAKKARKKGTRIIYTAHGFHFYKGAPLKNWLIFYPIEKILSRYTDTLITINKEDYELAQKKFRKKCKDIQYVPGVGVNIKKIQIETTDKEKKELKKSIGLKNDDYILTCIARLDDNKNQGFLINVIEQLIRKNKKIHLLLVGGDELNGFYQNIVKTKKIEENIHFLGNRTDVPQLLSISDIVLSASKREGLPVNVIEAFASGIPVIALNCRGMSDLIENDINGYIVSTKKEMENKIILLKNNKTKRDEISKNNKIKAQKFNVETLVKITNEIYFKKKKILHLLATNKFSGAENVVCTIIKNMSKEYDMYYCSPDGAIKNKLKDLNITHISLNKLSYKEVKKAVKKIKPDIIHAHDNKATVYASFFHKQCKIISHIHGNNKIMNNKNIKTILFNQCSKKIFKCIWVSDSSLKDYYFKTNLLKKSIVLYNVIDKDSVIKKANEYEVKENYDLIFLGRLAYPKNPERAIDIIKILKEKKKNISLAIVGDGTERRKIENMVKEYKLEKNITFYGFQQNPYPILKKSKIMIMTSIYEGTPMCALEAQALGKPIIATPVDGLKKIVKNNINGYLSDDNNELAEKIIYFLQKEKKFDNKNANNELIKYTKTIASIYEK